MKIIQKNLRFRESLNISFKENEIYCFFSLFFSIFFFLKEAAVDHDFFDQRFDHNFVHQLIFFFFFSYNHVFITYLVSYVES